MRILELKITAFGPFTGKTLDLSSGNPGLHVVYGPNEAGKSSALRALYALLYGVRAKTVDAFIHPYDSLRIGGCLRHSSGAEVEFVRRKGNKNTLLAPDGTRMDDHALDLFLGGESAEKFELFWGIDHTRLVQGGHDILEGHGDLGETLFAAGSGVSDLRKLRKTLDDEASVLFTPRGHRVVNHGVSKLRELHTAQREAIVSADDWVRRDNASRDGTEMVTRLSLQEQEMARERSRIERVKRILPMLAERKALQDANAALADVVLLSDDFPTRRLKAEAALRAAKQDLERAEKDLRLHKELVDQLGNTPPVVAESEAVNQLHLDLGKHRKALLDRPGLVGQRDEQRALAKRLLAEWRPDLDLDGVAAMRVFTSRRARIRKLAAERERLSERLSSAERNGEKALEQDEILTREATDLSPVRDAEQLIIAIKEAQRKGDAEDDRAKSVQLVKRLTTRRDAAIQKLGLTISMADRMGEIRTPTAAAISRFTAQNKELDDATRSTKAERVRLDQESLTLNDKIETLQTKKAVPTDEDLVSVRSRRDAAFDLLHEHWEEGHDVAERGRELLGEGKLVDLYRTIVDEADTVADRLRVDADQVAKLAQSLEDRARIAREVAEAEDAELRQKETAIEIEIQWRALWESLLTATPSIEDALTWRTEFDLLLERSETLAEARGELERLDVWIEKQTESLRIAIAAVAPDARRDAGLAANVGVGERLRQRIENENLARDDHARRAHENRRVAIEAEKAKHTAQEEIDVWQRNWTDATLGLLSGDVAPTDDVLAALDGIEKVVRALDEMAAYDARVAGIDRDAEQFREYVRSLAKRLNETVENQTEDRWVEAVHKRLSAALQEDERRQQAIERLCNLQSDIERYGDASTTAELALSTLREEAHCGPDNDLALAEQRNLELRTCRKEIERVEHVLVHSGDGASIKELESEAACIDRDTMDVRLAEIAALLIENDKNLQAARDARATAQAQLGLLQGPSVASEKAEEIQSELAKLRVDILMYARLRVASTLLARRIDDYRRRNQAPLLLRASMLFRKMTLDTFERLEADMDDDRPILIGVKHDGTSVPADGMSEGTRDQLFLALRLAAVEVSCATSEPLPFIVDDILVQFDDERTAAALRVLADVASHTQVVLFTHHRQVRMSAEAMNSPSDVIVHDL